VQNGCYPFIVGLCHLFWCLHDWRRRKKRGILQRERNQTKLDKNKEYYKGEEVKGEK
jgi:hypothetical protein